MTPIVVGVHEAKTNFSKLLRDVEAGREVIVRSFGKPVAKLVPYEPALPARRPGALAGRVVVKPGFDELPPGFEAFAE